MVALLALLVLAAFATRYTSHTDLEGDTHTFDRWTTRATVCREGECYNY